MVWKWAGRWARELIEAARGRFDLLLADRGYDSNAIRSAVAAQAPRSSFRRPAGRKIAIPYEREAHRARNLVERLWSELKEWRRIATRYDKLPPATS